MKLLVTGGAGFIGANFITAALAKTDADILCVDALTYAGNRKWLGRAEKTGRVRFFHRNICDREGMYRLFQEERPDAVIHFAAETHVDRSITGPALFLETNVLGTEVLLDACVRYGISRFHQVSTDEVYGDLPLAGGTAFREADRLAPSSPYGASKAAADLLVLSYRRTYGLPVTISRCSNNYGPFQFPEKLIPFAIQCLLRGRPVPLYGDGLHVRDWLYVQDHCEALLRILQRGREGEIYHIGGHCEINNRDVVRKIASLLSFEGPCFQLIADRPGHDRRYALQTEKIERELSWTAETPFAEGLARTVRFYEKYLTTGEVQYDL